MLVKSTGRAADLLVKIYEKIHAKQTDANGNDHSDANGNDHSMPKDESLKQIEDMLRSDWGESIEKGKPLELSEDNQSWEKKCYEICQERDKIQINDPDIDSTPLSYVMMKSVLVMQNKGISEEALRWKKALQWIMRWNSPDSIRLLEETIMDINCSSRANVLEQKLKQKKENDLALKSGLVSALRANAVVFTEQFIRNYVRLCESNISDLYEFHRDQSSDNSVTFFASIRGLFKFTNKSLDTWNRLLNNYLTAMTSKQAETPPTQRHAASERGHPTDEVNSHSNDSPPCPNEIRNQQLLELLRNIFRVDVLKSRVKCCNGSASLGKKDTEPEPLFWKLNFDKECHQQTEKRQACSDDLFLWSILSGRDELEWFFWQHPRTSDRQHCISRALLGLLIVKERHLLTNEARLHELEGDSSSSEGNTASASRVSLAERLEKAATDLINACYKKDPAKAVSLITMPWVSFDPQKWFPADSEQKWFSADTEQKRFSAESAASAIEPTAPCVRRRGQEVRCQQTVSRQPGQDMVRQNSDRSR